ncbi:kinase-like domain-containing protein [Macrophomina phaseolina]|uniref:Kinase-like domain-containing protein n=1 Tax=Macrophomina phaseolina TaxID=35725 RepID=A0ABQ8G4C1_9PEZI|nr:kinase-like domain-containing protein [Macrophomina phaseolina]
MSTPSTATATLPPHHQYYPHHQSWQPQVSQHVNGSSRLTNSHYNNAYPSQDLRRTATVNARQPQQAESYPTHYTADQQQLSSMPSRRRNHKPDWNEFYKNGIPKEVIVIDDDSPEPQSSRAIAANGADRHTDKKRKTATSTAYDPVYHQNTSYSTTETPLYADTPSNHTISTDRTASALHTTASTSLGSTISNGAYAAQMEDGVVGQKRKRTTRRTTLDEAKEAKRRETEQQQEHWTTYVPPKQPPIKAKDVYVKVVPDYRPNEKVDDEDGHYVVHPDADLTEKYQIVKLLGQGTFGKVVEAFDKKKGNKVAIKVIRSVQKYRDASRIELRVLSTLASNDPHNRNKCIHLRDCFDFRNHICIVTDLYGQSVFDFLKSNQFVPFPSTHIQTFAHQLLTSVAFLHDLHLIHTDLKPENILLVNNSYQTFTYNRTIPSSSTATARSARHRKVLLNPEIRLIDFGSATFDDEYHSSVVSTRHYRAPEIILNLGWSYPCDIWSIGCILVEFFTGDALFQTHDNLEHLAMMEAVCGGKLDKHLIRQVLAKDRGQSRNPAAQYFKGQKLDYPNQDTPKASRKYVKAMKRLQDTIPPHNEFNLQFLDLLKRIFVYDPSKRISAKEALNHPWFDQRIEDDGTEALKIRKKQEKVKVERARQQERENGYR